MVSWRNQRQAIHYIHPRPLEIKFGHVDGVSYLCHMKLYLKTPTEQMTTHQIRKVVCETIKWCETNIGKKTKSRTLKYRVLTLGEKYTPAYGMYCPERNTLFVFRNHAVDVKMVVRSVLHEYTHFMQNLRWYSHILNKVGYMQHPQEKHARAMEYFYGYCWKDIKNKL